MSTCICRGLGYYDRWSISLGRDWHEDDHGPVPGRNAAGESIDVAPADSPYWVPGTEVTLPHSEGHRFVERARCLGCEDRRQAFADRREAKQDRREARIDRLRASSDAGINRSREMLPWGGQPILVGHHSEKRHRRDQERSHDLMRKSIDEGREADRLEGISASTGISSDDPDAIMLLREKLAGLEAQRARIKAFNKAARKARAEPREPWVLSNLGGNISRVKQRIADLERAAKAPVRDDVEIGQARVHWDRETNRVQVFAPDPGPAGRKARSAIMRPAGFVWARSNGCWQRQASATAWALALDVCKKF